MDGFDLVFIGIDVVADAADVAESRRWTRARAPRGLWRRLGVGTGIVLKHPDAPLGVALAPADSSLRGLAAVRNDSVRLVHDEALFAECVEDCPVVEALLGELLEDDAAVRAA